MAIAMTPQTATKGPVHLRFDGGTVYITPRDSKRFQMTAKRAVETLQHQVELEQLIRRFESEYLPWLHNWCQEHQDKIKSCYLWVPTHHGLTVLVVGTSGKYDFQLGDLISELAVSLQEAGWPSNILQIVDSEPDSLLTYFDPEASLQVYAES